jgi:drug/metabolite transporter (DMT)-like permease
VLTVLAVIGMRRPRLDLRRSLVSVPVLILAGLLVVGANVLFTTASTRGFLSVVAVLGWLSPAFTVVYARTFLHEHLRPLQWFAAALVFGGVICLAIG